MRWIFRLKSRAAKLTLSVRPATHSGPAKSLCTGTQKSRPASPAPEACWLSRMGDTRVADPFFFTASHAENFAGTTPGRKHWGGCYSVLFAGAGVTGGAVVGSSDKQAAYPQADPLTPGDVVATLFAALGIDPAGHYTDPADRPYRVATGDVIKSLW